MRKVLKYLRIAWSVACGILCLLVIALWIRSYWVDDCLRGQVPVAGALQFNSIYGAVTLNVSPSLSESNWKWNSSKPNLHSSRWRFRYYPSTISWYYIAAPHWFLAVVSFTLAAIPWFRWRFSLRTLFIAMTLVAVLLGAIVFSTR
jgi:hypothetical protein